MLKNLVRGLLISSLLLSVSASENEFPRCNCFEDGFWSVENILECQRVSDFLIAVAYFSIPIELLYFVSCSNVPFKWVLFQFIAFIVLCGLTHLLNGWTYGPHPFQLMLALTIFKFLTALVSCATAITLITLIPLLLKVKVREFMLKKKAWDLGREVGIIKRQKEAGLHVRMLTQEIRKSLDRHTILYTTLVELSKTLDLQNCAVWMPNEEKTKMNLTHELKGRNFYNLSIPIDDPDVAKIRDRDGVKILRSDSALGAASSGGVLEPGPVAAIRMPMLRVSNFKGGTPELIQASYAILVLVLPFGLDRNWTNQEMEIIKVVADQVAVALSHAAVLEESQLMREKLVEQNRALQLAKKNAMMASQARNSFQKVMSDGMRRPMHSIVGLLLMLQDDNLQDEQKIIIDTMVKSSSVLSNLINDVMEISTTENVRFPLDVKPFGLRSMVREAACLAKCLCIYRGFDFSVEVEKSLPNFVMGDERRVFQVILHMIGGLLDGSGNNNGMVMLRVSRERGSSQGRNEQRWGNWRASSSFDGYVNVKFEIRICNGSQTDGSASSLQLGVRRYTFNGVEGGLSFSMCRRLVQLMQGNIWVIPNLQGFAQSMSLVLQFQQQQFIGISIPDQGESTEDSNSYTLFRGLQVLLADEDGLNRAVTRKLLEKLGCSVTAVSAGFECLAALGTVQSYQIVLLDLQMPDLDGFEITIRIRKFCSRTWPLIVALVANDEEDVRNRCLQVGMNGIITKPVLLPGIADELRRVLMGSKLG